MDPDNELNNSRNAIREYYECKQATDDDGMVDAAEDAIRAMEALDHWLTHRGRLPIDWVRGRS